MSVRPIIQLTRENFYVKDTVLRRPSEAVSQIDLAVLDTIADLIDTMNAHRIAVGLSAPQIGILSRVSVVNTGKREGREPIVLVNPRLVHFGEERETKMEACMSLPFFQGPVERVSKITVVFQDATGAHKQMNAEGFLARVLLHEMDHLDGILYVDRMPPRAELVPAPFFNESGA